MECSDTPLPNPPPEGEGKALPRQCSLCRGSGFFCLLALGIFVAGCAKKPETVPLTLLSPTAQRIELMVEVADTPEERSRGLMFREELPEGQGMLFVFDRTQTLAFWMKNTLIPLDILFFDADGFFVSAATMFPCEKDPCQMYSSGMEAQYALEVPAGFIERFDVASMPIPPLLRRP